MTPTARLTHALRSLADALEGPLPCSDPEMPAQRILDRLALKHDLRGGLEVLALLGAIALDNDDPVKVILDAGLCDE